MVGDPSRLQLTQPPTMFGCWIGRVPQKFCASIRVGLSTPICYLSFSGKNSPPLRLIFGLHTSSGCDVLWGVVYNDVCACGSEHVSKVLLPNIVGGMVLG